MSIRWEEVRLSDAPLQIIDGDRGSNYPKKEDFYDNEYCLFLNTKNLTLNGFDFTECQFITKEKDEKLRKGKLKRNDLVLTTRGTLGNIAFYDNKIPYEHIRINSGMVIIRPEEEKISPLFISFLFENMREEFLAIGSGSAQPQLPIKDLKNITIKLPPLKEQEKIAEILSSCDEHIKNLKNLKSELEKEKLHLMNELLSGKTRFANFTTPWQEVALKDIFDFLKGQGLSKGKITPNGANECILYGELYTTYKERINCIVSKTDANEGIKSINGDILIPASTTTTGIDLAIASSLNKDNVLLGGDINILRKKIDLHSDYAALYIRYMLKNQIASYAQGTTIIHLYANKFSHLKIKLPSLEEQKKIGEVLSACDERLECLNELITAQTTLKSHLLTELLTGNIRVNI